MKSAFLQTVGIVGTTLCVVGLMIGCGSESGKTGALILKSSSFDDIQGRTDVTAVLTFGGKSCLLTVDPNTTLLQGQCAGFPLGSHTYRLEYRAKGVVIARADGAVTIPVGRTAEATIESLDTTMDDDGDGYTNLEEVLNGTEPVIPDSGAALFRLIVAQTGTGTGAVNFNPQEFYAATDGSKLYPRDTPVTLTAVPGSGYAFGGWAGDCSGATPSTVVTLDADKTCTAVFAEPWTLSTLDVVGTVGQYGSVALNSTGQVHVAYYDAANGDLKYITNATGAWGLPETVDGAGDVGRYASIALDSSDRVHVAYYDAANGDLKYATNAMGSWLPETVDGAGEVGWHASIALDASDQVHIGYFDAANTALKYATDAGGSWVSSTVDDTGDAGRFASLAVDGAGTRYFGYDDATNGDLKYAETIPAMTLFSDDFETGLGNWTADSPWGLNALQNHTTGGSNSAAANLTGQGLSVSLTMNNPVVITGTAALSFWHRFLIGPGDCFSADCGLIEISTDEWATLSILDKYWNSTTLTSWAPVQINLSGYINQSVKMRFRLRTSPFVSTSDDWYIDDVAVTQDALISTIDQIGSGEGFASLTLDAAGGVHLAYYDAANKDLKYAVNASGSWTVSTLDAAGDVGKYNAIRTDSNGKIHISYYDATNGDLKYATNALGSWVTYIIDSAGDVGPFSSIAVDSSGRVHIVYYDATNGDLKYAANP